MPRLLTALIASTAVMAWTPVADPANWVSSQPLSPAAKVAVTPQLAVTPSGERMIAWVQEGQDGLSAENVSIRTAPAGGDFGPTQTIPAKAQGLQMAMSADGTLALGWAESASRTVHIARRAPGQTAFTEATPLVVPGEETPFGVDIAFRGADVFGTTISNRQPGGRGRSVWALELAGGANAVTIAPGAAAIGGALEHAANDDLGGGARRCSSRTRGSPSDGGARDRRPGRSSAARTPDDQVDHDRGRSSRR